MTWDEVEEELETRGFEYYVSAYGPIPIGTWSKPDGGTSGQWEFVGDNAVRRVRGDGTTYEFR